MRGKYGDNSTVITFLNAPSKLDLTSPLWSDGSLILRCQEKGGKEGWGGGFTLKHSYSEINIFRRVWRRRKANAPFLDSFQFFVEERDRCGFYGFALRNSLFCEDEEEQGRSRFQLTAVIFSLAFVLLLFVLWLYDASLSVVQP